MTASVVFPTVHGFALSGTSRNHMLWFNESTHLILSYKNRQVCTRMSGQVYVKILATPEDHQVRTTTSYYYDLA